MDLTLHKKTCQNHDVFARHALLSAMASGKPRDWAWALHSGGQMLWHQRRVIGRMAVTHGSESQVFAVVSPDGDVQIEDFSGDHEDIAAVRYAGSRGDVPLGMFGCLLYKLDEDIAADLMVDYRHVAKEVSEQHWIGEMPGQT